MAKVNRCERMSLPGRWKNVICSKVKVELVRNSEILPNIIHAFGTSHSAANFQTWKLQCCGSPRYCYGCGATSHKARYCREQRITREVLERMKSVVGEEEQSDEAVGEQEETVVPNLTYAVVVKDPTFLENKRKDKKELAEAAAAKKRDEEQKKQEDAEEEDKLAAEEELLERGMASLLGQAGG